MTAANTVLITGATSGIGYEFAQIFAQHNYDLIIVSRDFSRLSDIARDLENRFGVEVLPIAKDLAKKESAFELYEEISALDYQVDILINNAGQTVYGKFSETNIENELDLVQLNIGTYLTLTKLFVREMVVRGEGKILNVSSIAAKVPGPYQSVYHGTKAFVHSVTEAIRAELAKTDVTITSLLPGPTDTDIFHKAHMEHSKILNLELADPAEVAQDGFDALMRGDDMVISGFINKALVAAGNVMSDATMAKIVGKLQEPQHRD